MINYLSKPFKWFFKLEAASGLILLIAGITSIAQQNYTISVKIDGLKTTIKETEHTVKDMEYIRYQYEFTGNASSIIAYVFLLETSIDFFSKIWGYDEEGGEHQLLKYPVGSMVCVKGDQSADYLVIDLNYSTRGSNTIDYIVTEIKYIGSVIKYGDTKVLSERELSWSRNGRIDDILGD